ncbi:oligopeptide transport system ATP-binding protein [Sporobacter termitidis DSM 10068]|uniref:Oligopeptide transport system ATP-binding protein n=1 Tax=Sporobacter termitidis DSM 10068 TaxID=1123282 RepID=A0A1M5XH82_9FIRM|nr:ABC transporter ATP-binding protein [Sporobacter termitidis]SHH99136.1 oligopeptide transport system ATP-binding protein [Sporobacter termitidis DSM 10068]
MERLLTVSGLTTEFRTERGTVKAVNDVSYHVDEGEIIGLVGESGCGKSVSQLSVMQLIPNPPGKIVAGSVEFEGQDLLRYGRESREMCAIRGGRISMVFQEPMTSLNPAMTICRQMGEVLTEHLGIDKAEARERSVDMLSQVGIPDPGKRADDYPHQLSGGMRQRVMVGMSMLCNPKMIIADEATTALDATIQAQLLELMYEMVNKYHTALVMVTHNLGIVARYVHRVNVMYAGRIIESGTVRELWANPMHPYTEGLLKCVPKLGERLVPIKGMPPSLINRPPTCPFLPRCRLRQKSCFEEPVPELTHVEGDHYTTCRVRLEGLTDD